MPSRVFKDKSGYAWTITIDAAAIERVKQSSAGKWVLSESMFDRLRPAGETSLGDFWEVLTFFLELQIVARKMTATEFAAALSTEAVFLSAVRAFLLEWATIAKPKFAKRLRAASRAI